MNPCVFIILSLLLLLIVTTTGSPLVAVGEGRDDNGVMNMCFDNERHALLLFKAPLQDPNHTLSTWTDDKPNCCEWSGVTCDNQTGHVTELDIRSYGLRGEIGHSLIALSYLNHLDLSYNSFHGNIPNSIGSLNRLNFLRLSQNSLNGTIPWSIGSLTELEGLDLSFNSLYGTIPPVFGNLTNLKVVILDYCGGCRVENIEWLSHLSHLETLAVAGISLAKANHWVDVISTLQKLSILSLEGCQLSRVMYPYSSFINSSSSIEVLHLNNNNLTSSMYSWLRPLTNNKLRIIELHGNILDGIPKYLGDLCSLEYLGFGNNSVGVKFMDILNNLSGCTSLTLQELYAGRNQLTGSLSNQIQNFSSLKTLNLQHNHLNGAISEKLWELPLFNILDLDFNNLTMPSTYHISSLSYIKAVAMKACNLGPHFPKWIQTLKNLTVLDLANNGISDTIPLEFWDMWPSQLLYLNLSSNNISGKVPDLLSNVARSSVIDLSSNKFFGPIPNVSSNFSILNLSRNNFSGGISFLCQIVGGPLSFLDLSHNLLTGQLPDCLWDFKELQVLNLGYNNLFGRLPPSIGSLIKLKVLNLYNNNFSGQLPLSIQYCTQLYVLDLGANKFSGNVSVWIREKLSRLGVLILRSNKFSGNIPLQLCHLSNLQILDLSMNNLHGAIPLCLNNLTSMVQKGFLQDVFVTAPSADWGFYVSHAMLEWKGVERELFSTLKMVKCIDLSSNNLTGQIPYEITNLHNLTFLNLSRNALFGDIPQKIGEIKNLEALDLSRNNLSGQIPSSMSQMTLLSYLDVSFNNLSGRIPLSTQLQSFEPSSYDGNTGLCGLPLSKKCPRDEAPEIGKSEGDGEGVDEVQGWFYIGGGIGFGTGFWIACGALLFNRRGRHAFFHFYDSIRDWVYVKVMVFIAKLQKTR